MLDGNRPSQSKLAVLLLFTTVFMTLMIGLTVAHEEGEGKKGANLFAEAETIIVPYVAYPDVVIDGKIGTDEYGSAGRFVDEDTGMEAYLLHDGMNLYVGLKNPGHGWVAIGFGNNVEDLDTGANVVIGYMDNETQMIQEFYTSKITGEMEVRPVGELGGKNDIISVKGVDDRGTTIEFTVPLNSRGEYGRHFEPGKIYPLIIAFNDSLREFPTALDRGEIHFEKVYVARQSDNRKEILDVFAMKRAPYSPYDTVIVMAIIGLSAIALLIGYTRRR